MARRSADKIKEMEDTVGSFLSYGRHGCLGKNVAMMEINKVFAEVSLFCSRLTGGRHEPSVRCGLSDSLISLLLTLRNLGIAEILMLSTRNRCRWRLREG